MLKAELMVDSTVALWAEQLAVSKVALTVVLTAKMLAVMRVVMKADKKVESTVAWKVA